MTNRLIASCIRTGVLALGLVLGQRGYATPTIWNGPTINFAQSAVDIGAPPDADVIIPGAVSLARNGNHWLYNTNVDLFGADAGTPSDTEWAFGSLANYSTLTYRTFDSYRNFNLSGVLLSGGPMVCHLINEDIYFSVQFTAWPHGGGLIAYTRSTTAAVAPPTPTVSLTAPTNNSVFAAPANVTITASASVSTGTVTNVQFFAGANSVGSKTSVPFSITANGLAAGSYALTAVATAGGISATSAPVNINVVTPENTTLSAAGGGTGVTVNNQFVFSFSTTPGLRYEVDISSNLFNWTPVSTNVATGNPSFFTNPISGDGNFYRVGRLPNP